MGANPNLLVKNVMELLVMQTVEDVLSKFPEVCRCDICRTDILALALNQLPPKYTVTEKGELFSKIQILEAQYRADIIGAITKAIIKVSESPRCSKENN
ncbi:MAG: late competence development ComFB family protein [Bacillota bacterium]